MMPIMCIGFEDFLNSEAFFKTEGRFAINTCGLFTSIKLVLLDELPVILLR
jgi:hypothetical protein